MTKPENDDTGPAVSLRLVVNKQRKQIDKLRQQNEKLREALLKQSKELGHESS